MFLDVEVECDVTALTAVYTEQQRVDNYTGSG